MTSIVKFRLFANITNNFGKRMSSTSVPTFVPQWTDTEIANKLEYRRLGRTEMIVSTLSLGQYRI